MARNQVNLPSGPNASWLDILPLSQRNPSPRRRGHRQNGRRIPHATPQMLARMQTIRSALAYIKTTLDARVHLQGLVQNDGLYCPHCTPLVITGHCDPTCPLLRPTNKDYLCYWCEYNDPWLARIAADSTTYHDIIDDMDARGMHIYAATVGRWERVVSGLMEDCKVTTEIYEEERWPVIRGLQYDRWVAGQLAGWDFGRAWGKKQNLDAGVAPEDLTRLGGCAREKRKQPGDDADYVEDEEKKSEKRR